MNAYLVQGELPVVHQLLQHRAMSMQLEGTTARAPIVGAVCDRFVWSSQQPQQQQQYPPFPPDDPHPPGKLGDLTRVSLDDHRQPPSPFDTLTVEAYLVQGVPRDIRQRFQPSAMPR